MRRTKVLAPIRVYPEEKRILQAAANRAGMPLATWLRTVGLQVAMGGFVRKGKKA